MKFHIVQVNEKIKDVSRKYNVSVDEIIKLNRHINNIDNILPGMKLRLPILSEDVSDQLKDNFLDIEKYYPKLEDFKEAKVEKKVVEEEMDNYSDSDNYEETQINVIPQGYTQQSTVPFLNNMQQPMYYQQPNYQAYQNQMYMQNQQPIYPPINNPYQPTPPQYYQPLNYNPYINRQNEVKQQQGQTVDNVINEQSQINIEPQQPQNKIEPQQPQNKIEPQLNEVNLEFDENVKEIKVDLREFVKHTKIRKKDSLDIL